MMTGIPKNSISWWFVSGLVCLMLLTTSCGLTGDLYLPDDEPEADNASLPLPEPTEDDASKTDSAPVN